MNSQHSILSGYSPSILCGLLLGLSVPRFAAFPLGFLAWFAFVPLLIDLNKSESFTVFTRKVLIAIGLGFGIITIYVANSSLIGFFVSWLLGTIVWSVPFFVFFLWRRYSTLGFALVSLPFVWTLWEWIFHQSELSFGAIRLGGTQAEMIWLIQFLDLIGIDGLTFWLITVNLLIYKALTAATAANPPKLNIALKMWVLATVAVFALPIAYSINAFYQPRSASGEITVAAVQPNVSPFLELTPRISSALLNKQLQLTEKAISNEGIDLIVWHEGSLPFTLSQNEAANRFLAQRVSKIDTPILVGAFEMIDGKNFNSAFIVSKESVIDGQIKVNSAEIYAKRRMIPLVEFVPYEEYVPAAERLLIGIGARPDLTAGKEAKTFEFVARNGATVRGGSFICYENLYPEPAVEAVQNGAEFLVNMTNEGWFGQSNGQYQLAAFSRMRSIETRREMIRVASTGYTWTVDIFGRIKQEVPPWSEQVLSGKIVLSDEKTPFVRNPRLFPVICAVGLLILLAGAILRKLKILQDKL